MGRPIAVAVAVLVSSGCATVSLTPERRALLEADAQPAVAALQGARFPEALELAKAAAQRNPDNARAEAVHAVALYQQALHDLVTDLITFSSSLVASGMLRGNFVNRDFLDFATRRADGRLAEVSAALDAAAADPGVSLELCLACWEVDWNRDGRIDQRDRQLLQIERDAHGELLPPDDPRRRPTFRFDQADVYWLAAMVDFQRAALATVSGYDLRDGEGLLTGHSGTVTLKVRDANELKRARTLILAGLDQARRCRAAVLAETDDDREWLPNPRQKSHAMPLEVDDELFDTWKGVLDDVQATLESREGLPVAEMAQLGHHQWATPPQGSIDLGRFFSEPHDLVIPLEEVERSDWARDPHRAEELLGRIFGSAYRPSMPASSLLPRLKRMRRELDLGHDTLERKLRYLLWLN